MYGELSEQIIRTRAASDKPFFFYASYTAPHNGGPVEPDDPRYVIRDDGSQDLVRDAGHGRAASRACSTT